MIWKISTVVLGIIVIAGLLFGNEKFKEADLYKSKLNDSFKQQYRSIERELRTERELRRSRDRIIDSLNNDIRNIQSAKLASDRELKAIKGRYANRTTSELEQLMISKFNNRK